MVKDTFIKKMAWNIFVGIKMETTETIEKGNIKVEFYRDECLDSPREWDNLGKMVCFHNRYGLPNETNYKEDDFKSWVELRTKICSDNDIEIILPIYMYDHSGITIKTTPFSCHWDSGQIGYIYVTKNEILKNFGKKTMTKALLKKAEEILKNEINIYDKYLTGDVYGFAIIKTTICECCKAKSYETIERIGGFYDYEEMKKEALAYLNVYLNQNI